MIEKEKPITSDLFEVEKCFGCNGEGVITQSPEGTTCEHYEDCDICKGSGILQ
jgi:DnaJ-class molecular chaperone